MNCKKCGAVLLSGQTICSVCNFDNSDSYNNVNVNDMNNIASNNINNTLDNNMYTYTEQSQVQDTVENDVPIKRKQNIVLKIASILALIAGIAMLVMSFGNFFVFSKLYGFNYLYIISIIVSFIFLFYAFVISNFDLGKNKVYDSKILFIILLIINFIVIFLYKIYAIIFILSLIGFIISITKNKNND